MTLRHFFAAIGLLSACATPAIAEKRVALVVGNSSYSHVSRLANPVNDATAIEAVLKGAGFDSVESRRDLSIVDTRRVLRDFTARTRDADIAVVYYAGHGIEVDGINYIIPIDAMLEQDTDIFDEAFSLDRFLVAVEPAKQLRLVILDACRDNPFAKTMKRTVGSRAVGRGLAKVEPTSPNTMIAFAAKAGSTASDGENKNSPFAAALVRHIATPGLDLRKAFGFVRDDVMKSTGNRQEPYVYGSLGGNDVSLVPSAPAVAPTLSPANTDARRDYEAAIVVSSKAVWDAFILEYPKGLYTELAKAQRNKLIAEDMRAAATERAKTAEEEKARLALEGARVAEQTKAAKEAKIAEEARLAAEKKKATEDAKVAEAERVKAAAVAKLVEEARTAAEKKKASDEARTAEAERKAKLAKEAEEARLAAGKQAETDKALGPVASLVTDGKPANDAPLSASVAIDIPRQIQSELRRVGCNTGSVDGNWNTASQRSLALFNRHAGTKVDVKLASLDVLDLVKSKPSRICPLICENGYRAEGDACKKITCRAGYEIGDNNNCERIEVKRPAKSADRPDPAPVKPADKQVGNTGSLYGQCRNKVLAGSTALPGYANSTGAFDRIEACVRGGGKI